MSQTPKAPRLTDEEYVAAGGLTCPFCRSSNMQTGTPDFDGSIALVVVDCIDCGEYWTDEYRLVGYSTDEG